jgi:sugar phosphate isomerase/epimerase
MKIACQEGLVPGASFAEKLRNLQAYGFEGVELNGALLLDPQGLAERRAALKESPVRASSICGGSGCELVHPDPARRRKCADAIMRLLEIGGELGATGAIAVPIFNSNDRVPDLSPWKTRAQVERELLIEVLRPIAAHGRQVGSVMLLEPLNRYESNSLPNQAYAAEIVREVGPGVRLMSDFFHMHLEETNLPQTLRSVADVLGHIHLADNTRKEPGSGFTDFRSSFKVLREIGYSGYMALECGLTGPAELVLPRSAAYLRDCMG